LWQISGNGLKQPSYLFGTMHILCAEDAKLSESLKEVIRKTAKVYFEVDMDNLPEMMGAMKYMRMNDGIKISDLLTKEEYTRLETF
ncbi:TraB/GumN family protein, partial [Rhizobium leguminosarum]|uniref:TraB/GumN family protein n=1 Tax=Rhizobium leguminosarum TaxID=384 RepID=UPI003F95A7CF